MLDDLRNSAASSYLDEEEGLAQEELHLAQESSEEKLFLGMTASQRFVIVLMMLMMTCVLGTFFLVATEKIVLPFL